MSSRIVLTSHRPKLAAIGILLFIVTILFCASALTLSPVDAEAGDKPRTELAQPEPTLVPNAQTAALVFLPLIAQESIHLAADHNEAPPLRVTASSDRTGNSETPPPTANNHTFVTDEGGHLDDYWYRFELPNGQLTFTIAITAPVTPVNAEYVLADGSLTNAGLEYMMSTRKLSYLSSLQLHVFDVDHDAPDCAEVDSVSINGHPVGVLRSGDAEWDTWSMNVPTLFLRFPIQQANGEIQPAINEIAIDVDAQQCDVWAVEIDWGAISVRPSLNYGLLFVHGWTGNDGTFQYFNTLAGQDGYQIYQLINYNDGIQSLDDTASLLRQEIVITATTIFTGVDKVYVVAHSRGGLFTRTALRQYPELASKIAGYITLSTPHHGADILELAISVKCRFASDYDACVDAAHSFSTFNMRRFNYGEQCYRGWTWNGLLPELG